MTDISLKPGQAIKCLFLSFSPSPLLPTPPRGSPAILRRVEHQRQKLPGRSSGPAGPPHTRAARGAAAVPGGADPPGGTRPIHRSAETLWCSCLRHRLSEITSLFTTPYRSGRGWLHSATVLGDLTDKLKFHFRILGRTRLTSVPVE